MVRTVGLLAASFLAGVAISACLVRDSSTCTFELACVDPARPLCDCSQAVGGVGRCVTGPQPPEGFVACGPLSGDLGDLGGSDGPMPACTETPMCPASTPICVQQKCAACTGANDDVGCKLRSTTTPRCDSSSGQCVECRKATQADDCTVAAKPTCGSDGRCRACLTHDDCDSLVCNADGTCAPEASVAYVDNANGSCTGTHSGVKRDPYCQLQAAIDNGTKGIVRILGSSASYTRVSIGSGSFTVIGPGPKGVTPSAKITNDTNGPAVTVMGSSTQVTLDGVEIVASALNQNGIACLNGSVGPTLTVRKSVVSNISGVGISSTNCKVTIERNQISVNRDGGLVMTGSQYAVSNNFIFGNGTAGPGVSIGSGCSELSGGPGFRGNTVAKNTTLAGAAGVQCSGAADLRDSIIWSNTGPGGNTSGGSTCNLVNVVTAPAMDPNFVDALNPTTFDFHLNGKTAANLACCIDKVATSPLTVDYDGRARPQPAGGMVDIGAHEVP